MAFALGPKALAAGYRLVAYETIGSTSTEAMASAARGDPGKLWVVSREQTAGHGRRGQNWQTPPGNLAASLLRPAAGPASATIGFAAGLALENAIRAVAPSVAESQYQNPHPLRGRVYQSHHLALKWPNDVLLNGAKIAGILLEAMTRPGAQASVVIGIGVNVAHAPKGVPYPVSSLIENGADISAETLFIALGESWVEQDSLWNEGRGFAAIRDRWLERAAGIGAPIAVKIGADVVRGTFETIDEEGRLIVRGGDGSSRAISAGDVHFGAVATAAL